MKLKRLSIHKFKNFHLFGVDFSNDNLSVIIGNNGSGKSNILEAISNIFDSLNRPPYFSQVDPFVYSIKYEKNGEDQHILCNESDCARLASGIGAITDAILPSNIIAIYSGENSRILDKYFRPHSLHYFKNLRMGRVANRKNIYLDSSFFIISILLLEIYSKHLKENKTFLREKLNLEQIQDVLITISPTNRAKWKVKNQLTSFFDAIIDPHRGKNISIKFSLLKKYMLSVADEKTAFMLFSGCLRGKYPLWNDISFTFKNTNKRILSSADFSEGELKLALIRAAMEFVSDENSVVLLDEPDSHIHEARKRELIDLLRIYAAAGRSIVMTTHSAMIADLLEPQNIIMLDRDEQGNVKVEDKTKQELRNKLLSGSWNLMQQQFFANSTKPLLLAEGLSDVKYIKKAMELLDKDLYQQIDVLPFNGTGNASDFINNLIPLINPSKTVIALFDRDPAGAKGLATCIGKDSKSFSANYGENVKTYKRDNIYFCMLPVPSSQNGKNGFLIEDYFHNSIKKSILKEQFKKYDGSLKTVPSGLENIVKSGIEECFDKTPEKLIFDNFATLIDKIKNILNGSESVETI